MGFVHYESFVVNYIHFMGRNKCCNLKKEALYIIYDQVH